MLARDDHSRTHADEAGVVHVFMEIVPSDPVKYELDKASGHLWIEQSVLDYGERFGAPEARVELLKRLLRQD